MKGLLHWN